MLKPESPRQALTSWSASSREALPWPRVALCLQGQGGLSTSGLVPPGKGQEEVEAGQNPTLAAQGAKCPVDTRGFHC